jgi:hypothetical protein
MVQSNTVARFDTVVSVMTETEARRAESEIIETGDRLRTLLVEFYERQGYCALGYSSYTAWAEVIAPRVFGATRRRLAQELTAAVIERELGTIVPNSDPIPESHLRPMSAFVERPRGPGADAKPIEVNGEAIRAVWQEANERTNGHPTARVVNQVVDEMLSPEDDTLDPPMELEQVADLFPEELTPIDRQLLQNENDDSELDSNEWYTPTEFIKAARSVMESIDVDPASNDTAQKHIQAGIYYTKESNGLAQEWNGNVWLNPPYGDPLPWVGKLLSEFKAERTKQAILLVNTANSPEWSRLLWHSPFAVCLLNRRVRFWRPDRTEAKGTAQDQMIWYIGYETDRFREVFKSFGAIR